MAGREEWYQVEELVPAEHAIGGRAYWTALVECGEPLRLPDLGVAANVARDLLDRGRAVRLVRVTHEVIPVNPED